MSFRSRRSRHALRPPSRAKRLRFEPLEARQLLTVTVNSTDDYAQVASPTFAGETGYFLVDGVTPKITLRSAIQAANAGLDDDIQFSSSLVIEPGTSLPAITHDGVTINGGGNVTLDGTTAGGNGIVLNASESTIQELTIRDFTGYGILIASTLTTVADDNTVIDNLITHNGVGVAIVGDSETRDTADLYLEVLQLPVLSDYIVNSTATGNEITGNQIKNNTAQGVLLQHASTNTVSGNTIGDNGAAAVEIFGAGDTTVETFAGTEENPNAWEAYTITNSATGNRIVGNWIGIDSLDADLGNMGDGVLIDGASLNTIGGTDTADKNVISFNSQNGVRVTGAADYQEPMTLSFFAPAISGVGTSTNSSGQTTVTFDYAVPTNQHVRLDFYYVAPTAGGTQAIQRYVGGVGDYHGSAARQFTWTVPTDLGSVSGGYLAATATYDLYNANDGTLKVGSITSQFVLAQIP